MLEEIIGSTKGKQILIEKKFNIKSYINDLLNKSIIHKNTLTSNIDVFSENYSSVIIGFIASLNEFWIEDDVFSDILKEFNLEWNKHTFNLILNTLEKRFNLKNTKIYVNFSDISLSY